MTHKIIKATLLLLCLALTVSAQDRRLTEKEANDWADRLDEALIKNFWGASFKETPERYYFNKESRQANMSTGDYWPQAHAADVLTDAFLRTSSKKYSQMYDLWWQGMPRFNPGAHSGRQKGDLWWNAYVDDMEWHCLALIRIYEATGEVRYLNKARQMYADWIWTQWSPEDEEPWHGGITWKTDVSRSKNACSNGPAAIIAARLALFAPVDASYEKNKPAQEYQGEAQKIYQWERKYLWNAENGAIYDNMKQSGRLGRFSLSYNQGTFIGAAVELYRLTGDKSLLDDAILTARYTTGPMSQRNDGVLPDADGGDGGLFHGIFFRYLANLIVLPDLDEIVRKELTDYLQHSAYIMTSQGINPTTNLYGGHWRRPQPADRPSALTSQLTACMLLEAVCKVNAFNMQERAASVQKSPGSLVPSKPSTAPDYYCTWNLQGYVCSYGAGAGSNDLRIEINEDNLFGRELGDKVWGTSQTKTVLNNANPRREVSWAVSPRYQGWLNHYPMLHGDLTFVMDDSWDIPCGPGDEGASKRPHGRNYDNEYLATMSVDATRFPSFRGGDLRRMKRLVKAVRRKGWRSLGGWVCAQNPIGLTHEYTGRKNTYENSLLWTPGQEERFWKMRLRESQKAGFSYWKVDWGNKDRDEQFRRRLSRWADEVAPDVLIEHASFQDGGTHHPDFIQFSPVIRSYDVNNHIAQAQTLQRLADLAVQPDAEQGWGIINCEDEPYIAAGLGCAIGVMRHPYVADLPNGKPDTYFADFGPQSRRLKNRLNEVVRAVRWHRIARPFGHKRDEWLADTAKLYESGGGRRWEAPARMSRGLPLPEILGETASDSLRPYVLAALYDNGCAAVSIINRNIDDRYLSRRVDVRFCPAGPDHKIGVFGYVRSLTITFQNGLPGESFKVFAQDLATDGPASELPYALLPDGRSIRLDGSRLEALCKGHDYPYTEVEREADKDYTDLSDPAVVLQIIRKRH